MPLGLSAAAVGAIGAGVSAAGSVAGSLLSSSASVSASKAQQASDAAALQQQQMQTNYTNSQLLPYGQAGQNGNTRNQDLLDNYGADVTPYFNNLTQLGNSATAQQALEQTPGYSFALNQGLKATQNAAAARGLGVSGAALKGAASYATGLANNTYQQQYQNALSNFGAANTQFSTQFGANNSIAQLGEAAAAQQASSGQAAANNSSSLITGSGNAAASGDIGSANALSGGFNGVSNALSSYNQQQLLQKYLTNSGSQYTGSDPFASTGGFSDNAAT